MTIDYDGPVGEHPAAPVRHPQADRIRQWKTEIVQLRAEADSLREKACRVQELEAENRELRETIAALRGTR